MTARKLSRRDEAAFEQASLAYEQSPALVDPEHALVGEAAAASGRRMLEDVLGGPSALERALGGRPPLTPRAPKGHRSPVRSLRLPEELSKRLDERAEKEGRRPSDVLRDALTGYLAGHP